MTATLKPAAHERPRVKAQVARFIGLAKASEEQLLQALVLVAERHEREYEMHHGATLLAIWSRENIAALEPAAERYGSAPSEQPEKLRAALLGGTRMGGMGALQDLQDLSILVEQCRTTWTILYQGAKELHDEQLLETAAAAREHSRRQLIWLRTQIEHDAPETLAVEVDAGSELAASRPKRIGALASIPDSLWGPTASALLLLVVGLIGLLAGRPWLLPSLGPSAVLQADNPAHPAARAWNVFMGHMGGLMAGLAGVLLFGALNAPVVLSDKVLAPERVGAAVVAIFLTVLVGALARASHPPAAATTLLVALGSIRTATDILDLVVGVVIITVVGEGLRRLRLDRVTPAERMAPSRSTVRAAIRE